LTTVSSFSPGKKLDNTFLYYQGMVKQNSGWNRKSNSLETIGIRENNSGKSSH